MRSPADYFLMWNQSLVPQKNTPQRDLSGFAQSPGLKHGNKFMISNECTPSRLGLGLLRPVVGQGVPLTTALHGTKMNQITYQCGIRRLRPLRLSRRASDGWSWVCPGETVLLTMTWVEHGKYLEQAMRSNLRPKSSQS